MSSRTKKRKTRKPIFLIIYFSIITLFLVGLITAWIVLKGTLTDYENSMPQYVMEDIKTSFLSHNFDTLLKNTGVTLSQFETEEQFKNIILEEINGKNLTYDKKSDEYSVTHPVYNLLADGNQVATVSLKEKAEKSKHGFTLWELESIAPNVDTNHKVDIIAPQNVSISINGIVAGQQFITNNSVSVPMLSDLPDDVITKPVMVQYEITGLLATPAITASDATGVQCNVTLDTNTNTYTVSYPPDPTLEQELSEHIVDIAKSYSEYMSNDITFANLSQYISKNVPLYNNLSAVLTYFYADHISYDFQNLVSKNFVVYSEDCLSYDVSFDYIITMANGTTHTYPTNLSLVMIKEGDNWKLGSLITGSTTGDTNDNNSNSENTDPTQTTNTEPVQTTTVQ